MNLTELGRCDRIAEAFAPFAAAGYELGRVGLEHRLAYRVYTSRGEVACGVTGQFRHQAPGLEAFPAVGDWVVLEPLEDPAAGVIHQVLPRHSQVVRKVAGAQTQGQVVAANVDTLLVMMGLDGDFNLRRLERYLVLAHASGARPVIVLNKADSGDDVGGKRIAVQAIAQMSAASGEPPPVLAMAARRGEGIDALDPYLQPGQTIALIGSSGVGKSTLTNQLLGDSRQATQAVRAQDQRGRHTTTHRQLLPLPGGAWLIDTPGMRELQLWAAADGIEQTFGEIEALARHCRFRDCQHQQEPGCAVLAAIAAGDLDRQRLVSYHRLQREQQYLETRQDGLASRNSKRRWKEIHRAMRQRRD